LLVFLERPGVAELVNGSIKRGRAGIARSAGPAVLGAGTVSPYVVVAGRDPLDPEPMKLITGLAVVGKRVFVSHCNRRCIFNDMKMFVSTSGPINERMFVRSCDYIRTNVRMTSRSYPTDEFLMAGAKVESYPGTHPTDTSGCVGQNSTTAPTPIAMKPLPNALDIWAVVALPVQWVGPRLHYYTMFWGEVSNLAG
jgi:hypothetical protein